MQLFFHLLKVLEKILRPNHTLVHEKQNIQILHEKVIILQQFLEDCPQSVKILEGRIRDAANEARNIIEFDQIEAIKEEYVVQSHHVEKQIEEIDCVVREAIEMKNSDAKEDNHLSIHFSSASASSSRVTASSKDTVVVGITDDLLKIQYRLCGESSKLQIVPIVGMGGLGKTTLAKAAYEDPLIVQHFDIRAWATVSQNYRPREIYKSLLRSITKSNEETHEENDELLREKIYKKLKGRRYLIVMDDMWSTDVWDDIRRIFPDDCNGSRIVVTTRLLDVAVYTNDDSSLVHEMQLMDDDHSWKLLQEKVFGQENCPRKLKEIGKMIAKNCRGLPLAIVVIGGILSKADKTEDAWRRIGKSVGRVVNTSDVLSLSYDHLPHHLRPCFLYLGDFPEDDEIEVSFLIKLWVAEGFLKPSRSKSLEEVAEDNLKDLLNRNLILGGRRKHSNGQIRTIKIHDVLRDLCLEKAQEEEFSLPYNNVGGTKILVRRSIYPNLGSSLTYRLGATEQLLEFLQGFKLLWVLNAENINIDEFPTEVVKLFHLRYLALLILVSGKLILPRSILKLQNLQTLIVSQFSFSSSKHSLYLPSEIWGMQELRHVISLRGFFLPDFDGEVFALINLQTLSLIEDFTCTERILQMIPNVKKLGLLYNYNVPLHSWSAYELRNLVYFNQLEKLKIIAIYGGKKKHFTWKNIACFGKFDSPYSHIQCLSRHFVAFPHSLRKLTLVGCGLPWKDMTIVGSLPNLEVLKLKYNDCKGDEWETNEGEFCKLKMLLMEFVCLLDWTVDSPQHFPKLEHLLLHRIHNLKKIPSSVGEIPTLQLIAVDKENRSLWKSAKHIQEEQRSFGNDALEVRTYWEI